MKEYLFSPPGALPRETVQRLEEHDVLVIETEAWRDLRVTTAEPLLPSGEMFQLMADAINAHKFARDRLGELLVDRFLQDKKKE